MGRIPEDIVERVLASTDIVDLVGQRVSLKRVGSRHRGLCPFHNEKTPSFYVDSNRQRYHCFGCGADGSAAGWLMNFENRTFPEAIKQLAQGAGIAIQEEEESPEERRARAGKEAALGALAAANAHWTSRLWSAPDAGHARAYLESRQLDEDTAREWDFGHADGESREFLAWARSQKLTGRALVDSGLCSLRDEDNPRAGLYARFRDRLMFPIRDGNGRIVGFSGRILDPEARTAKYVNTPETPHFKKGSLLFGLDKARRAIISAKRAILCEGQLDCIALHKAGLSESIAPLGTAFTPEQAKQLTRLADTVVILFDGDPAGLKAARRAAEVLIPAGLAVRVALLPEGEDPDSFLQQHGRTALDELLDQAPEFFDHLFQALSREHDLSRPDSRQAFAEAMVEGLQLVPDSIALEGLILRTAARLGVPDAEIRQRVSDTRRQAQRRSQRPQAAPPGPGEEPEASEQAAAAALQAPDHPLIEHLCLLLLLPEAGAELRRRSEDVRPILEQLPRCELARRLLAFEAGADNPAAFNRALSDLPAPAEAWLNDQLARSPLSKQPPDESRQRDLVEEVIQRLRRHLLRRRIQAKTSQMKAPGLDTERLLGLQKHLAELRNRLAQIESGGLLE